MSFAVCNPRSSEEVALHIAGVAHQAPQRAVLTGPHESLIVRSYFCHGSRMHQQMTDMLKTTDSASRCSNNQTSCTSFRTPDCILSFYVAYSNCAISRSVEAFLWLGSTLTSNAIFLANVKCAFKFSTDLGQVRRDALSYRMRIDAVLWC